MISVVEDTLRSMPPAWKRTTVSDDAIAKAVRAMIASTAAFGEASEERDDRDEHEASPLARDQWAHHLPQCVALLAHLMPSNFERRSTSAAVLLSRRNTASSGARSDCEIVRSRACRHRPVACGPPPHRSPHPRRRPVALNRIRGRPLSACLWPRGCCRRAHYEREMSRCSVDRAPDNQCRQRGGSLNS